MYSRGDSYIKHHPTWATADLSDLAVDRFNLRNKTNVSCFINIGVEGLGRGESGGGCEFQ